MIAAKLGIAGALQDIQNNHPNDMVSMLMFSRPGYSGDPAGIGQFSVPRVSLGRDYTAMINSLWFPPNSGTADIRPWRRQRAADALRPRRLQFEHGDRLRLYAGLQPIQRQLQSAKRRNGRVGP